MAGKIVADTLEHSTAGSVSTQFVKEGAVKCFLVQSGGTPTTHDSLNISSVTDQTNAGVFVTAFTNAFDSVFYRGSYQGGSIVVFEARNTTGQVANDAFGGRTTSSCITADMNHDGSRNDADEQKMWSGDLA
tara:strand:- start:752 stop:1147 length:396 start_codon:yes stop_codon:yes gene_type:complete